MRKIKIIFLILLTFLFVKTVNAKELVNDYNEKNYNIIMKADEIQTHIKNQYNIKEIFKDNYPEYFGGIYISDDMENIIIQIVEKNIPNQNNKEYKVYNKIINFNNLIKIKYVENSFNELNEINNLVSEYIDNEKSHNNVIGCYIDVINNKVVVEMTNINATNKVKFLQNLSKYKSNIKLSIIKFSREEMPIPFAQTIKSGGKIIGRYVSPTEVMACSMGFRTQYNNQYGYVTAGHCLIGASQVPSGSVLIAQFYNNQYYDYGFVATNSNYTTSNVLAYPSGNIKTLAVAYYCPAIIVNMAVAKSGIATQYTSGKVTALNQTVTYTLDSGAVVTIKGLIKTNVKTGKGDSGAPVFIPRDDSNGGPIPIGVVSGGNPGFLGIGTRMNFTSINTMPSSILMGRY